ncbi:hypothetical protein DZF91_03215 [Actinomadura logoneensis]|uniref:Uncharacterized protein n=1 Tax=Actinomadura logoneensis TaxID=2293572 RepID=A0A372JSR5_9ACTN|nr:hypothetical protein [Actinomadura logoneensis]RFU43061.1 hypothetical protein DZF91_03215 [Actinomadura logoneensis]
MTPPPSASSGSSSSRFARAAQSRRKDAETGQVRERGTTARRTTPVRITIDLAPEDYRTMRRLVDEIAAATDIPTLAHSRMWRALLAEAADDPALLTAVADRIRDEAG